MLTARRAGAVVVTSCFAVGLAGACGDDSATGGAGGDGAGSSTGPDKVCIDRATLAPVPPAGLKVSFRVLDGFGDPVRPLDGSNGKDIVVINDEKGTPFGSANEGDAVSDVGVVSDVQIYSALVLDMSDSIFNAGVVDDVIDGAVTFVNSVVVNADPSFRHNVAIIAFGAPDQLELVQDFTQDGNALLNELDALRSAPSRGTTDLYDAYRLGIELVDIEGDPDAVVERFVVLLTDGEHEAGAGATLRELALASKDDSTANKYVIGIRGAYNLCALEELAGPPPTCAGTLIGCRRGISCNPDTPTPDSCTQFQPDVEPGALNDAFQKIADRAEGIARSNYEVGVCTPVALGNSSLTIRVDVDGAKDSESLPYSPAKWGLTGAVNQCDATAVKNSDAVPPPEGGGGMGGGGTGGNGTGGGGTGGAGGG